MAIEKLAAQFPRIRLIWADGGYAGKPVDWVKEVAGCELEIARRRKGTRIRGSSPAVGGGEDAGLAEQVSPDERGLRKAGGDFGCVASHSDDLPHAKAAGDMN